MLAKFKEITLIAVISVIIILLFGAYVYFIGRPKTMARNYYNRAQIDLKEGQEDKAIENMQKALEYWEEDYIREELEELRQ